MPENDARHKDTIDAPWAMTLMNQGARALIDASTSWLRLFSVMLSCFIILTVINTCMLALLITRGGYPRSPRL